MKSPKLIILSGIPGTGKSTLIDPLSQELSLPVLVKDEIEAVLYRNDITAEKNSGWIAYDLLSVLAEEQLRRGVSVIIDSVAGSSGIRNEWRELAGKYSAEFVVIECICSDTDLHRQRLTSRKRNIAGWPELTWEHVLKVQSQFQPWDAPRLILDSTNDLQENVERLITYVKN